MVEPGTRLKVVWVDDLLPVLDGDRATVAGVVLEPFGEGIQVWLDWDHDERWTLQWGEVA